MAPARSGRDPHPARRARRTVGAVSIASTLGLVAGLGLGGRTAGAGSETDAGSGVVVPPGPATTATTLVTTTTTTDAVLEAAPGTGPLDDPFDGTTTSESRHPSVVPPPPPPVTVSDGS